MHSIVPLILLTWYPLAQCHAAGVTDLLRREQQQRLSSDPVAINGPPQEHPAATGAAVRPAPQETPDSVTHTAEYISVSQGLGGMSLHSETYEDKALDKYLSITNGSECPTAETPYVVAAVFAGRRDRMHVLLQYLGELHKKGYLHEFHLWNNADGDDRAYVADLRSNFTVMDGQKGQWANVYNYYNSTFKPGCKVSASAVMPTPNQTVFMKVDDDIVFLDVDKFPSFVNFVATQPEQFIVHANTINNGVTAYYQMKHLETLHGAIPPQFAHVDEYPHDDFGHVGFKGFLWDRGDVAAQLHNYFIDHMADFSWEDPAIASCQPLTNGPKPNRISINFMALRLTAISDAVALLGHVHGGPSQDDEGVLTTDALLQGRKECIFTPFNVAHLAFMSQEGPCHAVLSRYEELAQNSTNKNEANKAEDNKAADKKTEDTKAEGKKREDKKPRDKETEEKKTEDKKPEDTGHAN